MFRLIIASCAIAACAADAAVDPKLAKILKEQRFNAGDGRTGAAFATEDGHIFREESDNSGNRIGQYSYIGDDGKTYTVKYSAGVDGFRILSGDHIPSGGQEAAAYDATDYEEIEDAPLPAGPKAAAPRAGPVVHPNFPARPRNNQPIPVRAPQPQRTPQFAAPLQQAQPRPQQVVRAQPAPEGPKINPFINPHDPTHRNFQFNNNAANFDPENPAVRQANLVPDCADCSGVNPFINPFDASHQQASSGILAGHLAGLGAGQPRPAPRRPAPAAPIARPQALPATPVRRPAPAAAVPTPAPVRNFFPPGELKLNRFETGFNFDFSS